MPARPRSYAAVVKAAERALRAARVDHVNKNHHVRKVVGHTLADITRDLR